MSITKLHEYPRVIILFYNGVYKEYTENSVVELRDIMQAQLIIAIQEDGVTRILKNRWGNVT